jgi:hypothetical protein
MATATKKKEEAYPWKASASSGHTTNLKQSILRLLISMGLTNFMKMLHNNHFISKSHFGINLLTLLGKLGHLSKYLKMRGNQLPDSVTRWQNGSQICFETFIK